MTFSDVIYIDGVKHRATALDAKTALMFEFYHRMHAAEAELAHLKGG